MSTDRVKTAVILCGGKGTRLREVSELLPKPMVPIGEQPIVWHIMKTYAAFGIQNFILCLGYKREAFIDYFMNYHMRTSDATITLGHVPHIQFYEESNEANWKVTLAGTGLDTMTGGRVFRATKYLPPDEENFFLTYGDGLSTIDMDALVDAHYVNRKAITISAVHPEARFGGLKLEGDTVIGFEEKSPIGEGYVNGGFMVVNRRFVSKYLSADPDLVLERTPMETAARDGEMGVFRHEGFWQCMDNQREYLMLNNLWASHNAPWTKFWK